MSLPVTETTVAATASEGNTSFRDGGLLVLLRQISIPTYVFVALFAISSWIDVNGVWVEVPLLVDALPEAWNLPSYLVVIIQIANIGPVAYTVAKKLAPNKVGIRVYVDR